MARKRLPAEVVVDALTKAANGMPLVDLLDEFGISELTFRRWKAQFSGLNAGQVRETVLLVEENARLRKRIVELSVERCALNGAFLEKLSRKRGSAFIH
ncbi:MAG: family transposase [Hyphomicrobiales bacterium]|nr:family transposase [Hyphomicrobiales bacterium]